MVGEEGALFSVVEEQAGSRQVPREAAPLVRVFRVRLDEGEQQVGGIIIPDTAKEKPQEGVVIAAGAGRVTEDGKTVALEIKEGDKVLYAKYAGTEIRLDDEDYLIVSERDVLAIIS